MEAASGRRALVSRWVVGFSLLAAACGESRISVVDPVEPEQPGVDLQQRLLLHLAFEETESGALARDASGHGHDATPSASPPTPSTSVPPVGFPNLRSLSFSGVEQFLDLGNPPTLDVAGTLSLCAWIRPAASDGIRNVIAHGWHHQPNQEVALRLESGSYHFLTWNGVDHGARGPIPEGDLDAWHHLCGVYDGQSYRLYRDGALLAESADAVAPLRVQAAWAVGARGAPDAFDPRYFSGLIDEVRLYGRGLSPEEVRALAGL
jgi:hypothetical protein